MRGHTRRPTAVAFSPDGSRLATASWDGTIRLWDTDTGQDVLTLQGHEAGAISVAFSRDGRLLVSGGMDQKVKLWDGRPR